MVVKYSTAKIRDINKDLEYEISHLISKSIAAEEPVDVFSLMGKDRPEVSIFDDKFLAQFRDMQYKNYGAELLTKIIKDQIVVKMKVNPIRYRSLYEMLKELIDRYNIKLIDTAEVIEELMKIAKEIKKVTNEGKELQLSEEELTFYDLLSSEKNLFENYDEIQKVAKEIVKELGYYIKVADWNKKEYIKAKIRASVKKVLIRVVDGRVSYDKINQLSTEIMNHAEVLYAA
jgi:type I restriction enzyme R subunit